MKKNYKKILDKDEEGRYIGAMINPSIRRLKMKAKAEISLSHGNGKIGMKDIRALSFAPITFCNRSASCVRNRECYNLQPSSRYMRSYTVREAWTRNTLLYIENKEWFLRELQNMILNLRVKYFRYFVSGECPDRSFVRFMIETARKKEGMRFLAFTKRYALYEPFLPEIPENLVIRFSAWPTEELPVSTWKWFSWVDIDDRKPVNGFRCVDSCIECNYKCWDNQIEHIILRFKGKK